MKYMVAEKFNFEDKTSGALIILSVDIKGSKRLRINQYRKSSETKTA